VSLPGGCSELRIVGVLDVMHRSRSEVPGAQDFEEESGYSGGGDMQGFITYPDDHSPRVESQCNKTGHGCSGKR
jgi:hypothetical protein